MVDILCAGLAVSKLLTFDGPTKINWFTINFHKIFQIKAKYSSTMYNGIEKWKIKKKHMKTTWQW